MRLSCAIRLCPLLVLASLVDTTDPEEAGRCLFIVTEAGDRFAPEDFVENVKQWLLAGAEEWREGFPLEELAGNILFDFRCQELWPGGPDTMPILFGSQAFAASLTATLLLGRISGPGTNWNYFITKPWEDLLRSDWPVFELVAKWADRAGVGQVSQDGDPFLETCYVETASIWSNPAMMSSSVLLQSSLSQASLLRPAIRFAAFALLGEADISAWPYFKGLCSQLLWASMLAVLSLASEKSLVAPDYALRKMQASFQLDWRGHGQGLVTMSRVLGAPLPILHLLVHVAEAARLERKTLSMLTLTSNASARTSQVAGPFSPLADDAAEKLEETLQIAHNFLAALGVPYILIAGTLLGASRHFDRIPWDDDVDLGVDSVHEPKLTGIVASLEAARLGAARPGGLSKRGRRALQLLYSSKHILQISGARSMQFRVAHEDSAPDDPAVDIWLCWHLSTLQKEEPDIILMSHKYGPKIPRPLIEPRQKMPFGQLVLWGPAEPEKVTKLYLENAGWDGDFHSICRGRKVHAIQAEYDLEVPCISLADQFAFAGGWERLDPRMEDAKEVVAAVRQLLQERLPGLAPGGELIETEIEKASLGLGRPPRYRLISRSEQVCTALLWKSLDEEIDLLQPGNLLPDASLPVRSLTCGLPGQEPSFIWEDVWT